jgi:hypothetical protein
VYQSGAPQTGPTLKVETAIDNSSTAMEIAAAGHGLEITSAGVGITATSSGNIAGYFNKTGSSSESVIVQRTFSTGTTSILTIKNGPSVLTTNSVVGLKIEHLAGAVLPSTGHGSSIRFASSTASNGAAVDTMDISSTLMYSGDDTALYKLQLSNGTSLTTRMEIEGATGQATLNAYGDWTFSDLESDTYTSFLATNSSGKVIEQNPTKFIKFGKTGAQNLITPSAGTNITITPTRISFDNPLVGTGLTPSISIVGGNTFQNTSTRTKFFHIDWSLPIGSLQDKGYWLTVWFGTTGNPLGGHYEQGLLLEQVAGETPFGGGAQNVIARGSGIVQLVPGTSYSLYAVGVFGGNPASLFTVNNWSRAAAEGLTNTYFWEPLWDGGLNMSANISFIELGYATAF